MSRRGAASWSRRLGALTAAASLAVACGGAAEKKPAESPPQPNVDQPAPTGDGTGSDSRLRVDAKKGSSEIDAAQRELDDAGADCKNACRALGSMDRAAGRLCKLSQTAEDRARCDDAKVKVYKARDRVRAACTTCAEWGGPSVERAAPIPSQ